MTSCAQCLSAMGTTPLAQMGPGSLIAEHVATCARCASVAEELRYAEFRLARALDEQRSSADPAELTVAAIDGSERLRRRRIGRRVRAALMVAACGVFFVFMQVKTNSNPKSLDDSPGDNSVALKTVILQCISPEQAMALATPYLQSKAGIWTVPNSKAITLRGRVKEMRRAISEIDKLDAECQLPGLTPPPAIAPVAPTR